MDKVNRKTVFAKWVAPISNELLEVQVKAHCLDFYLNKLHMASFTKRLVYVQLHETESLRATSDSAFSDGLSENSLVLSFEMMVIGITQNRTKNMSRLLKVPDSKGNQLNLLTNRFDLSEVEISELYKSCWAIKSYFKWTKQHLSIKKFYGHSEQSVHHQVYSEKWVVLSLFQWFRFFFRKCNFQKQIGVLRSYLCCASNLV